MITRLVWPVVCACLLATAAGAAEIEALKVTREDARIVVRASLTINAPRPFVFKALSDYNRFAELSTRYQASRFIQPDPSGRPRIYTQVQGCVWFFCRTIRRYAQLDLIPDTRITATVEPDESDVSYGVEVWELASVENATRVTYSHDMEPKFWVPPVIGLWAIRRVLNNDSLKSAQRIEKLALQTGGTR